MARRSLSIGVVLLSAALVCSLSPLLLLVAPVIDVVSRRARWVSTRLALWLPLALWVELTGLVSLGCLWLATVGSPPRRRAFTYAVQRLYTGAHFALVRIIFSLTLEIERADASGPVVVFMRHASIIDTLLPGVLLANPLKLQLRYVLKRELLWAPCLDLAGHWVPNHFVSRDGADTQRELAAIGALKQGLTERDGVLIYPEGTRFSAAKRQRGLDRLAGHQRETAERLRHLLPLRPGGALALLNAPPAADLLFVAHHGLEGLGSPRDIWRGRLVGARLKVKCWRVSHADLPTGDGAMLEWLAEQWQRLDDWLHQLTDA